MLPDPFLSTVVMGMSIQYLHVQKQHLISGEGNISLLPHNESGSSDKNDTSYL